MAGIGDCILVGPESMPYSSKNSNVIAQVAVASVSGAPQGPYPMGTQFITKDGRKYRYSSAGAVTLVVGNTLQAAIPLTTDVNMSATSGGTNPRPNQGGSATYLNAVGEGGASITHGAATVIANFFAEGFLVVSVTPGGGDTYKIHDHLALASGGGPDVINFWPGHSLRRALTNTTSKIDLTQHPNSRIIQLPVTTLTSICVGVCIVPLTGATGRGNFGWIQTRGACGVLTNGTLIIGEPATVPPTGAGGSTSPYAGGAAETGTPIGYVLGVAASTAWSTIFLTLDG